MKEVNDVREYEDEDGRKSAAELLQDKDDDAGHHNSAQRWAALLVDFFLTLKNDQLPWT